MNNKNFLWKTAFIYAAVGIIFGFLTFLIDLDNPFLDVLGYMLIATGVLLLVIAIHSVRYVRAEEERNREREQMRVAGRDDMPLRPADFNCKYRVFIGMTLNDVGLRICYRRVGSVNELIVNDMVYDEKRGVIEHAHNLSAVVNGHRIDAGFDGVGNSYLLLDGIQIASKMRLI